MRAVTVKQPWAWAIVHGGKNVENRSRNIAGSYRGPVAIHAGLTLDVTAPEELHSKVQRRLAEVSFGAVIGVADLVSVHHDSDHSPGAPCSQWALSGDWHLVLGNPRPLARPIPARGALGLWTPSITLTNAIQEALAA